ncbi:MAG: hypothetical protein V4579_10950 [Pseudomonadota bacterium]
MTTTRTASEIAIYAIRPSVFAFAANTWRIYMQCSKTYGGFRMSGSTAGIRQTGGRTMRTIAHFVLPALVAASASGLMFTATLI